MKTMKARKSYKCKGCSHRIEKGERYGRQQMPIGTPGDEWVVNVTGYPHVVQNWLRLELTFCEGCMFTRTGGKITEGGRDEKVEAVSI